MADISTNIFKATKSAGAMLGTAYGDALGWPNELTSRSRGAKEKSGNLHDFTKWRRRSGGRFFPYEEIIEKGEYSDDTQLILCLTRSLLKGKSWWEYFTQVELPFWSVYERGGGAATKRAADSWLDGVAPWSHKRKSQDVKRYYDAGGNGVAMRVLPHILRLNGKQFPEIAASIFQDGIITHGHPRALLGALVYGFALWFAFHKESKLTYGELVEELLENVDHWPAIPVVPGIPSEWREQAEKQLQNYEMHWERTKIEIVKYLEICRDELSKGALSLGDEVLSKLQCFNREIRGAGTVAAMAAVYLASRHAADPINGVVKAAFAWGADTDTIASMTGGLLGCINGSDWLSSIRQGIQDAVYIEKNSFLLLSERFDDSLVHEAVKRTSLENWIDDAILAPDSSRVSLPDRRMAEINRGEDCFGRSKKFRVKFLRFIAEDGQTIYINRILKNNPGKIANDGKQGRLFNKLPVSQSRGVGIKIPVDSLERAVLFYRDCLGLTVKKQNSDMIVFEQGLVLVSLSYIKNISQEIHLRSMIYIQATNIAECFRNIKEHKLRIITDLTLWGKSEMLFFRSLDTEGNIIEVFHPNKALFLMNLLMPAQNYTGKRRLRKW